MEDSELERATDLTGLLEDDDFLRAFCHGCELMPKNYFDECPAGFDIEDAMCARRCLLKSIRETLQGAQEEIMSDMRYAGCCDE